MAQSATTERALLGIEPFWEKPTLEPPLRWDRWQIMLKLAIMAKEGISIDILLEDPHTRSSYLLNLYTRIMLKIAHLSAVKNPGSILITKAVSLTYLSLGMEGRRILGSREPNIQIDRVTTKDLWESLDRVFTKQRTITFDRYTVLTRK